MAGCAVWHVARSADNAPHNLKLGEEAAELFDVHSRVRRAARGSRVEPHDHGLHGALRSSVHSRRHAEQLKICLKPIDR